MNNRILGWLVAGGVLFAAACSNDAAYGDASDQSGEAVTVTFTISPEGRTSVTRAGDEDRTVYYPDASKGEYQQISDGTKAHMLIYAVYDADKKLLNQYGEGVESASELNGITAGKGQTVLYVGQFPRKEIKLRLMRNQTYYIAFWAQSVDCKAYDTQDLRKVQLDYSVATKNNDEYLDAFCKVESFTVVADEEREIILRRPLAQINVGTAGYDYELAVTQAKYLYSKIELSAVPQYLDVVDSRVLNDEDLTERGITGPATKSVTYEWAKLPAYVNFTESDDELKKLLGTAQEPADWKNPRTYKEQFLRVDLDGDAEFDPYVSFEDVRQSTDAVNIPTPDTEIFKYLSMCYVLVPFHEAVTDGSEPDAYGTTIDNVKFYISESSAASQTPKAVFSIDNVPVQRNWRTNILGKNLLTVSVSTILDIVPDYNGDYNYSDGSWKRQEN